MINYRAFLFFLIICSLIMISSCNADRPKPDITVPEPEEEISLRHVNYYIDNSGGMFGYVSEFNNYISTVSELAQKPDFITSGVSKQFNFINGFDQIVITDIGTSARYFTSKLNPTDFNVGNIQGNDLNKMFQIALENTSSDTLTIFITDAIYDIQQKDDPLNSLIVESRETRRQFISRLNSGDDFQTLFIKVSSNFSGRYYFGRKFGQEAIDMPRPFYIFVFGHSDIVNSYFSDSYFDRLDGYENHFRYFKTGEMEIPYAVASHNQMGDFRFVRNDRKRVTNATTDRRNNFQIGLAVDFSSLPLSSDYLTDLDNYTISPSFEIAELEPYNSSMFLGISDFEPSHVFTLRSQRPHGSQNMKLMNNSPLWISESHTDDDSEIQNQPDKTWGIQYLIAGIEDAYKHMSKRNYIVNMEIFIE